LVVGESGVAVIEGLMNIEFPSNTRVEETNSIAKIAIAIFAVLHFVFSIFFHPFKGLYMQ
jgi:hypothetical protein